MKALEILKLDKFGKPTIIQKDNDFIVDAIIELERLIKPKSCLDCKYNTFSSEFAHNCEHPDVFDWYEGDYLVPFDFCCNRYEPK